MIIKLPWFNKAGDFAGYIMRDCESPVDKAEFIEAARRDLRRHNKAAMKKIAAYIGEARKARLEAVQHERERETRMKAEAETKREATKRETADGQFRLF